VISKWGEKEGGERGVGGRREKRKWDLGLRQLKLGRGILCRKMGKEGGD